MADFYPCGVCQKNVISDAIECSLCELWIHRKCTLLTKNQMKAKSKDGIYWYCPNCTATFPFMNVDEEEFDFLHFNEDIGRNVFELYDKCSRFNFKSFTYTDFNTCDIENSIDPEKNFYNDNNNKCYYYTDSQFKKNVTRKNGISIIHFNCRSLKSNFDKLCDYLNSFDKSFDVIALSETWLDINNYSEYDIPGYEAFHTVRNAKRGGGVAIYVRHNFKAVVIKEMSTCTEEIFECITVQVKINCSKSVFVSCIYRAPGSNIDIFIDHLSNVFSNRVINKSFYLCGDFNIDLLNYNSHKPTANYIDFIYSLGLFPLITRPSRIAENSATLIDNILTNELNVKLNSGLLINDLSDHLPVFTVCDYVRVVRRSTKYYKYVRQVNDKAISTFNEELSQQDWNHIIGIKDVNVAYDNFIHIFTNLYNKHCPVKKLCFNDGKVVTKPWITKGLAKACKKKNRLYKDFLCNRTQLACQKYKAYKNKLTTVLRYAEKNYYTSKLESQKNNIKGTWQTLKALLKKNVQKSSFPESFMCNEKIIKKKIDIANGFNEFFINVGPNLAKKIVPPKENTSIFDYLGDRNKFSMYLFNIEESEIIKTVNDCCNKTSTDCNDINMLIVKKTIKNIVIPFTYICNLSFEFGIFPDNMKTAKVIPLFKSGENNIFTNYRPVSLLPQFSKILEKLFNKRLDSFIDKYFLLTESQYGFRYSRSTALAILELMEEITDASDRRKNTIGIFIDLKKAFDTIDHSLLLQKLELYGIRGQANNWIKSYLEHRQQFVKFDDTNSEYLEVLCGVPQGSILGPKLFIMYINDICNVSKLFKFILFADDTNLFCSSDNLQQLCTDVSLELCKLDKWFAVNKLSLNVSKTNYMLFGKNKNKNCIIKIKDKEIERVYVTKFLGVQIDDNFNWKNHIKVVTGKLAKSMSIIYRAKSKLNSSSLYTLYCSLFLPYLTYCSEIWGNTYKSNIQPIVKYQKKVIRLICNASYLEHTNPMFLNCKLLKFVDIVKLKTAIVMYKAKNCLLPKNVQNLFTSSSDCHYITRQKCNFKHKFVRTKSKSMCISVYGIKLWNSLSSEIQNSKNIKTFKFLLKKPNRPM